MRGKYGGQTVQFCKSLLRKNRGNNAFRTVQFGNTMSLWKSVVNMGIGLYNCAIGFA
jgi:hypothetical protein